MLFGRCLAVATCEPQFSSEVVKVGVGASAASQIRFRVVKRRAEQLPAGRHGLSRGEVDRHQRGRILAAFAQSLALAGYEGMSIDMVHEAAGVSRVTFYDHFADKEDAYFAVSRVAAASIVEVIDAATSERGADPLLNVADAVDACLGFARAEPDLVLAFVTPVGRLSDRVSRHRDTAMCAVERRLRAAVVGVGCPRPSDIALRVAVGGVCDVLRRRLAAQGGRAVTGIASEVIDALLAPLVGQEVTLAVKELHRERSLLTVDANATATVGKSPVPEPVSCRIMAPRDIDDVRKGGSRSGMAARGAQRKRSGLKYAVLGLVAEQPGYGYSLIKRLEQVIGDAYRLQESAVYVALGQLKADGLVREVERQSVGSSGRSDRVLYEATPEGLDAVAEWLGKSAGSAEPARSELVRQLALADQEHARALLAGIEAAELDCIEVIEAATRRQHDLRPASQTPWEAEVERLVHSYGIRMVNAQLEWFRDARAVLSRFAEDSAFSEGG